MKSLLGKLSIKALLYLSITVPLAGLLLVSGSQFWSSYLRYEALSDARFVQRLANAGGELAQALPAEAFSPAEQLTAARSRTDAAYDAVIAANKDLVAKGMSDRTIAQNVDFITSNWSKLETYRKGIDGAKGAVTPELRATAIVLQPVSAAGIDMTRRAGAVINDVELSRIIQGYFALMQVNDAGLIEMGFGERYLKEGKISTVEQAFIIHSRSLFGSYTNPLLEFLPAAFTKPFDEFLKSDDNAFMQGIRTQMYSLAPIDKVNPEGAARWMKASLVRLGMLTNMLHQSAGYLETAAGSKLQEARNNMLAYGAMMIGAIIVSILLSLMSIAGISRPLRQIVNRMTALAEGDTKTPVPYDGRKDEIGQMAHAVGYFRRAEIEKARLQADSESVRTNAELQRIEDQRNRGGSRPAFGPDDECARLRSQAPGQRRYAV